MTRIKIKNQPTVFPSLLEENRIMRSLLREYLVLCGDKYSAVMPPDNYLDRIKKLLLNNPNNQAASHQEIQLGEENNHKIQR